MKVAKQADPTLVEIRPASLPLNSPDTDITVIGNNFTSTCDAFVDDSVPMQKVIDASTIRVTIPASMTTRPGKRSILVHDTDSGAESNELDLQVLKRDGTL
jgi:hypothetical protein